MLRNAVRDQSELVFAIDRNVHAMSTGGCDTIMTILKKRQSAKYAKREDHELNAGN